MNTLWYTARGAGLTALIALSASIVLGCVASAPMKSVANRVVVQYIHRTAGLVGLALIVLHVTTIVLDTKAHVSVAGAFVPFAAAYRPNSVALGSIAAYALVAVVALGLARGRMAASARGARVWRAIHGMSYGVWVAALVHGILSGTDRALTWVVLIDCVCVVAVVGAVLYRIVALDEEAVVAQYRGGR